MVQAIKESISQGLAQKRACEIFGIVPRKFRRWANPKPVVKRTAWNKLLPAEREAIIDTAFAPDSLGKPLSHIFVHGHDADKFHVSLSSVYNVLKSEHVVRHIARNKRGNGYVSAHTLLEQGFSLLCYDATRFVTDSGVPVWALPVMILPHRYLLHIGHSVNSVASADLTRSVKEALALLPEHLFDKLIAHSDRGSAMKAAYTKSVVKELLNAPVHYGRPHTPDDESWIEAIIKTLKYHRDAPLSFPMVDDVVRWLSLFTDIYNNEPHSSLKYVTPDQALAGKMEAILSKRKSNLLQARNLRLLNYKTAISKSLTTASKADTIVVSTPT